MKKTNTIRILALIAALSPIAAFAHDDATLDKMQTPHGGQLRMSGAYHLELVVVRDNAEAKDSPITLYLTDHGGNEKPSEGTSANVILLSGKGKASATLSPAGGNKLEGSASYASDPEMKAVVTLTLPDGQQAQAKFAPLSIPAPK